MTKKFTMTFWSHYHIWKQLKGKYQDEYKFISFYNSHNVDVLVRLLLNVFFDICYCYIYGPKCVEIHFLLYILAIYHKVKFSRIFAWINIHRFPGFLNNLSKSVSAKFWYFDTCENESTQKSSFSEGFSNKAQNLKIESYLC